MRASHQSHDVTHLHAAHLLMSHDATQVYMHHDAGIVTTIAMAAITISDIINIIATINAVAATFAMFTPIGHATIATIISLS